MLCRVVLAWLLLAGLAFAAAAQTRGPLHDCAYEGNLDARIAACTDAINANKLEPVLIGMAHVNRGRWYVEKGDPERAIADFTRAINLDSQQNLAYFQRAQLHAAAGRKAEAIADYRKVLELQPGQSQAIGELQKLGVEVPRPSGGGGGGGSSGGGLGGRIIY
jgi:tetratricopeptide (TPR) repeat protein